MKGQYKYATKEDLIAAISTQSEDGLAPPVSNRTKTLLRSARRLFGTWQEACRAAGVMPRGRGSGGKRATRCSADSEATKRPVAHDEVECYLMGHFTQGMTFEQLAEEHRRESRFVEQVLAHAVRERPRSVVYYARLGDRRKKEAGRGEMAPRDAKKGVQPEEGGKNGS